MLAWALRHVVWFSLRVSLTVAGCITLQRIIQEEGYRCELKNLLASAAVTIVVLHVWMYRSKDT
jgi:hypothetical protein